VRERIGRFLFFKSTFRESILFALWIVDFSSE